MENEEVHDQEPNAENAVAEDTKSVADLTLDKEEVSRTESQVTTLMTVGDDSPRPGQNTVSATVSVVSAATAGQHVSDGVVYVLIKYPAGWKKDRHFKDGDIKETSAESAAHFVKAGFATIVEKPKEE